MVSKTITQRIALEGGDQVKKDLTDVSGAFEKLGRATKEAAATGTGLSGFIEKARKDFRNLKADVDKLSNAFSEFGTAFGNVARNVGRVTVAVGAAAAAIGLSIKKSGDMIDRQGELAESAGLTTEEFGRLAYAFSFDTVDAEKLRTSLSKLSKAMYTARDGSGEAADAFAALGINLVDSTGKFKTVEVVLQEIADAFANSNDEALKLGAGAALFGRGVADLLPTLNKGGDAIKALGADAQKMGIVFTKAQTDLAAGMMDAFDKVSYAVTGIRAQLALIFAPMLTGAADAFTQALINLRPKLEEIGKAVADYVTPGIMSLIDVLNGGDLGASAVGRLVRAFMQMGEALLIIVVIKDLIWDLMSNTIQPFLNMINSLFGTEFEGHVVTATLALAYFMGLFPLLSKAILLVTTLWGLFSTGVVLTSASILPIFAALALAVGVLITLWQYFGDDITEAFKGALTAIDEFVTWLAEKIIENWAAITENAAAFWEGMKAPFVQGWAWLTWGFDQVVNAIVGIWDGMLAKIESIINAITGFINSVIQKAKDAANAIMAMVGAAGESGGSSSSSGESSFARGGRVRGPGTSTSDSVPAWLSHGEFVQRAAAVRKYGAHFMQRINSLSFPTHLARGFAEGGLASVSPLMPAYASPVSTSSGRPVNLTIGGETFAGLLAPEDVAEKLIRFATNQQSRLIGRKPAWYGGR